MGGDCIYMSRFFISDENVFEDSIIIKGEDVNHIKNVLRCRMGDMLVLSNGKGTDFQVRIDNLQQGKIITKIENISKSKTESPLDIILFQGIPKGDKMDFIIQKSVELGVKRIVPVITKRTVLRFNNEKDKVKKTSRWQKIALEAAKQCNRSVIPKVDIPVNFKDAIKLSSEFDFTLIPYEKEKYLTLRTFISNVKTGGIKIKAAGLIIGPEGGFSEDEVDEAVNHGASSVTLGPRILRTETAGLAVLAILMYEFGDIGCNRY
jgi:16S rRNA (uracil1498-N3)-methyltransferase